MEQSILLTASQSDANKNELEEQGNVTGKFSNVSSLNSAIHSSQDSNDVAKNVKTSEGNTLIKDENTIGSAYDGTLTGGGDANVPYNLEYPGQPLEPVTEEPKKRKREEDYYGDPDCLDCCFLVNQRPGRQGFCCLCCPYDEGDGPSNGDVVSGNASGFGNVDAHGNSGESSAGDCCGDGQGDDCDCCDCGDGCDCSGCDGDCTIM